MMGIHAMFVVLVGAVALGGCGSSSDAATEQRDRQGRTVSRCVELWNRKATAAQKGELVVDAQFNRSATAFVTAYAGVPSPGQIMGDDPGSFTFSAGDCLVVPGGVHTVWAHDRAGWHSVGVDTTGTETTTPWALVLERADSAPNALIQRDGSLSRR